MKRLGCYLVLGLMAFLLFGCAGSMRALKGVGNFLKPWSDSKPIPPPQPGLVLPINENPGVWAECILFEGNFRERDLVVFRPDEQGRLRASFIKPPIECFTVDPPFSRPYANGVGSNAITFPLLLSPYPDRYTLLIYYTNFQDWVIKTEARRFSTTGYYKNDSYISGGEKIYADKVIRLSRVRPYQRRQFKFHRTFYPLQAITGLQ